MEQLGVETRADDEVVGNVVLDGYMNLAAFALTVGVENIQEISGDEAWWHMIYHADTGTMYVDGTASLVVLDAEDDSPEPVLREMLNELEALGIDLDEICEEDSPLEDWDVRAFPETVMIVPDAVTITDWEPNLRRS
jgi:hypothetical protein